MKTWEFLLYVAFAGMAIVPFLVRRGRVPKSAFAMIAIIVLFSAITGLAWNTSADTALDQLNQAVPRQVKTGGFISSKSCRSCHPNEYSSWHRTYHRTMTQLATPEAVVAPFDDVRLESRQRQYHLQRRGDEFWVTMVDPEWDAAQYAPGKESTAAAELPLVERRVVLATGSHRLQTFWVAGSGGNELRQLPWYYNLLEKRWLPSEDTFLEPPDGTRHFKVWNQTCIQCHSVAGSPGMDSRFGELFSSVAEFGISCEACHGPAEKHVAFHKNPVNRYRQHFQGHADATIVNPARRSNETSSQICGQCHGSFQRVDREKFLAQGLGFRAGDDLGEVLHLQPFDSKTNKRWREEGLGVYWKDGSCMVGGAEFNGLIESGCYQRGQLSCLSCHSMHHSNPVDQLATRMEGNDACLQCHKSYRDRIQEHTHHPATSSGSLCYNCHMPYTSYALSAALRSHRIDSPNIESSARTGRPNACNLCHLDKTLKWSADRLSKWYDDPPVELSNDQQQVAASLLWMLKGDAVQRIILAWHMGWDPALEASGTDWQAPFLAHLLDDSYSTIRFVTIRSLQKLPGYQQFEFDFIGPSHERSRSKLRALEIWRGSRPSIAGRALESILIRPSGLLNQSEIDRLQLQRDETPLSVPE